MIVHCGLELAGASYRLQGFHEVLEEAGLPYDASLVKVAAFSQESGLKAMDKLREGRTRFTILGPDIKTRFPELISG